MHFAHLGIQCTETLAIREGLKKNLKSVWPPPPPEFFWFFSLKFFAQKSLKKGPKPKTEGTLPSQTFQDGRFELSNTLFGDVRPIANLKLEFQAWKKQFFAQIRGFSWENLQKIIIYQLPNPYISGNKDFLGLSKPKNFFGRVTPQKMSLCMGQGIHTWRGQGAFEEMP